MLAVVDTVLRGDQAMPGAQNSQPAAAGVSWIFAASTVQRSCRRSLGWPVQVTGYRRVPTATGSAPGIDEHAAVGGGGVEVQQHTLSVVRQLDAVEPRKNPWPETASLSVPGQPRVQRPRPRPGWWRRLARWAGCASALLPPLLSAALSIPYRGQATRRPVTRLPHGRRPRRRWLSTLAVMTANTGMVHRFLSMTGCGW